MKYGMMAILVMATCLNMALGAEQDPKNTPKEAVQKSAEIQLPPKDSPKYWNVRSEAISELLPLLTKKRAEIKSDVQLLTEYLEKNNMASDFAAGNIPVPKDPNVFFAILQIGQGLEDMNIPKPKERPSWDEIMKIAMQHAVFEGYAPTTIEEDELTHYIEMCQKKEQYGQKVRKDLRGALDQCAKMWVFLDSIGKLADFKAYYAGLKMEQETQRAQEQAQYTEAHRQAVMQRQAQAQQQKFEDDQARAQFYSGRKEQAVDSRQSRLNSRAANAGINVFY